MTIDEDGNEASNGDATHLKFRFKEMLAIIGVLLSASTCSTTLVLGAAKYYVDSETHRALAPVVTHMAVAEKQAATVDRDLVGIKSDMGDVKRGIAVLDASVKILMNPKQIARTTSLPPGMGVSVP